MKQTSKRITSIAGSLVLVAIALFVFFDLIQPEYASVMNVKGQVAAENDVLTSEMQAVSAAQSVIAQFKQSAASQGTVALALPSEPDVAGALADVYGIAQVDAITVQTIGVATPIVHNATNAAATSTAGFTATSAKPLGSFSIQITGVGSYENFKRFFSDVETNVRIFDVKGVTFSPAQGKGDLFTGNITLATYYQPI